MLLLPFGKRSQTRLGSASVQDCDFSPPRDIFSVLQAGGSAPGTCEGHRAAQVPPASLQHSCLCHLIPQGWDWISSGPMKTAGREGFVSALKKSHQRTVLSLKKKEN